MRDHPATPPPRYPLTRVRGVLAPRAKLRPRIVPKLPDILASASACKRSSARADVPAPNILSTKHLGRIKGGLLFAATSQVPWATLLGRAFDVDAKACARCGARLHVRAVVTDHELARAILADMSCATRAPPTTTDAYFVADPVLA